MATFPGHRLPVFLAVAMMLLLFWRFGSEGEEQRSVLVEPPRMKPSEWFYLQRAFPNNSFDPNAYHEASIRGRQLRIFTRRAQAGVWEPSGPANIGGRITSLAIPRGSRSTIYIGSAAGGVFKTMDDGGSWSAIFDDQPSLTIGDLAVDPHDTNVVYVGTGEANGMRLSFPGAGVFKSTDGGESWDQLGLEQTYAIGRVAVDPHRPGRLFVAAMGNPFDPGPHRGLFRSTDGGGSWQRVLFGSDTTGCIDIAIDPSTPDVIYAALWQRWGDVVTSSYGGAGSGLYKSTDGGTTWKELRGGLPEEARGRIGIAIAPSMPNRLYTIYADSAGYFRGVFRSDNGGTGWQRVRDSPLIEDFCYWYGWWFGQIRVHPSIPDRIYVMGVPMAYSSNGGLDWTIERDAYHADQHALHIDPITRSRMILGNDGGLYISSNGGSTWRHVENLPITQFYTCEIDYLQPHRLYGGTQDNGTLRTITGSLDDWEEILGGDGFHVVVDPTDNRYVYAEAQYGWLHRSIDGGTTMMLMPIEAAGEPFNWNTPLVLDPSNPRTLYTGSNRIYQSTDRGANWRPISNDLSDGGLALNPLYGTITTIAVSPSDSSVIYAGTDDGNVWVTTDRGTSWRSISEGLPKRWVTRVAVDPKNPGIAYITFSGYRAPGGNPTSHIFRTTSFGADWSDISGNLPDAPVNDVIIDPANPSLLYIGTDVGVFFTSNPEHMGWLMVGDGLPMTAVMDLTLHKPTGRLVAATYGRSMYSIDVSSILGIPDDGRVSNAIHLLISPDPFMTTTTVTIHLASRGEEGNVEMFDLSGSRVRTLFTGAIERGENRYIWDGRDDQGRLLPAGIYHCRVTTRSGWAVRKSVLVR